MDTIEFQHTLAFLLTVAVESLLLFAFIALKRSIESRCRPKRVPVNSLSPMVTLIVGVNAITHPVAWAVWSLGMLGYWPIEVAVVATEALIFRIAFSGRWSIAFLTSLLLNFGSAGVGWLM